MDSWKMRKTRRQPRLKPNEEAFSFQKQYEQKLNIPVLLPIQEGVDKILPTLKKLIKN